MLGFFSVKVYKEEIMSTLERIEKNLKDFAAFSTTPNEACSRLPFSKETRDGANKLKELMKDANLSVIEDGVGNIFGTRKGKDSTKPAILCGSHYDSVYNGGNFDGIAGVMAAIEIAKLLDKNNVRLERDYIVAAFMDEEGTRFATGYFGSRAILGEVNDDEINNFTDKDGISIRDAMESYGLYPDKIKSVIWDKDRLGSFLELHIEQGPVLDQKKIDLGIVSGIVGMERYLITVKGRADHAGTTPMDMRKDAVDIATKVISKISDFAKETGNGIVATTGLINVKPGGMNIVASEVEFSLDIRSIDKNLVSEVYSKIANLLNQLTVEVDANWESRKTLDVKPALMDDNLVGKMEKYAKYRNYSYNIMPSGAGHDALVIGKHYPAAMIFVPSVNGRSHSPEEYTPYEYIEKGIYVLYDLITNLD